MSIYDIAKKRRTIRSFKQEDVDIGILENCVDAARLSPTGSNKQPLEYIIVNKKDYLKEIFLNLSWAGAVDWNPKESEMPMSYIVILANGDINSNYKHDSGIAAATISLIAEENNLGSCILGSINRENVQELLNIPHNYEIDLIVAIGYPNHKSYVGEIDNENNNYEADNIKYWRDNEGNFHIPKKPLKSAIHYNKF